MASNRKPRIITYNLNDNIDFVRKTVTIVTVGSIGDGTVGNPIRRTISIYDDDGTQLLYLDTDTPNKPKSRNTK